MLIVKLRRSDAIRNMLYLLRCVGLQLLTTCVPCKQIAVIPFNRYALLIVDWKTDKWSICVQVHRSHGESSNTSYV